MSSTHILSNALPSDAVAIAAILALSWKSPFSQLQFGSTDPHTLAAAITPRIAQQITDASMLFHVARRRGTQQVESVAQWTVPSDVSDAAMVESARQREERQEFEDEVYYNSLPEYCNNPLIMAFTVGLRSLRERVLCERKHFLLENIATHPDHRGQGLAAQLIERVLSQADKQQVLVYLDTASDNSAAHLYKRLGFEEQGCHTIRNLSRFVEEAELERMGVGNDHTHVAFVRYPTTKA
ncbi:acetyltransferase [Pyrenophora tritici-repentis]|uniref:Gnat family acetyltransferase n=2 Tax=Pyrenophora tritici-repentis TaxID=45151 RepID=A0A2W1EFN5_9PLEO|nr:uncharacterized protein PTRG_01452 [Pyrenophora tritici-repentis Pt-1C-BFP]KAI1513576.1 gnat family acetyltransferase [Pyrenophora tritici-repentis]EDU40890.1 predicted protein [Pyrenophora tritici-repentis Pt-1C-BFP]KAI1537053.1 acetyltransferase [Pyrenophora tritici-repentis]KAI1573919.1 acetyltransferase [Pyrenophora tritici-repentis]KAI1591553.1 acetyltransferase [Pyrenophora tritici-repentis]